VADPDHSSRRSGLLLLPIALIALAGTWFLLDVPDPDPTQPASGSATPTLSPAATVRLQAPPRASSSPPAAPTAQSSASASPTSAATPSDAEGAIVVACLVTLDGVPQRGGVLKAVLANGAELRAESDAEGRATLHLPRDRFVRLFPTLPSRGLDRAQVEALAPGQDLELSALSSQTLLQVGDPIGDLPPGGPQEGEDMSLGDEVYLSAESSDLLWVAFTTGARLSGRVVDAGGRPVSNARVSLGTSSEGLPGAAPALSDNQGRFVLELDPSAAFDLERVLAEAQGASGEGAPKRIEAAAAFAFEPLTLRLSAGEPLRGRVTDLEGHPLQARVMARVGLFGDEGWNTSCDPEGKFWFGALVPRGHWLDAEVSVRFPGYASRTVQVQQGAGAPPLQIRLTPLARCRGRVLSARGEPVEGASVITVLDPHELERRYGPANGGPDLDVLAGGAPLTDARGGFDFETPAGPRLLLVTAPGHGERVLATSLLEGALEVRLLPAGVIAGSIHTASGEPLDYRLMTLVPAGYSPPRSLYGRAPAPPLEAGPTRALPTAEVPTAVSSTVAREGQFHFQNVPPGRYDVYSRAIVWGSFTPRLVARDVGVGQLDVRAVFEPPPQATLKFVAKARGQLVSVGACEFTVYGAKGERLTTARPGSEGEVEIKLWAFGPLLVEGSGFGVRTIQRRIEVAPSEDRSLEPFEFDTQTGKVAVLVRGEGAFSVVQVEGKDPVSGRWVDASYSMSGENRLLTFPPGPTEIRIQAYGKGEELLKEVLRKVQVRLDSATTLTVDLKLD